ncbi:MAG: hypothetical protein UU64_C0007G0015 [candidate division WWE3 bacterium GW2011_GWF2_41_45]|nr:MAG: hypothetical protein UU64_C0007G0015 [candidate division WWE3 bacterium GW2011_GWF2_41_45]
MKEKGYKLIALITVVAGLFLLSSDKALADCESNYGGGETCIINKRFMMIGNLKSLTSRKTTQLSLE